MNKKQLLQSQMNAEEVDNSTSGNEELVKQEPIKNTPFTFVKAEERNGFIALGMYRITEERFTDHASATRFVKNMGLDWEFILNVLSVFAITFDKKSDELINEAERNLTIKNN